MEKILTAEEARNLQKTSIDSQINSKIEVIKDLALLGKNEACFYNLHETTISELVDLGYKVELQFTVNPGETKHKVIW